MMAMTKMLLNQFLKSIVKRCKSIIINYYYLIFYYYCCNNNNNRNSNMEVELIGDSSLRSNPLSTFKLSDSVILFQKNNFNKVERVPYANFISQKKHKPSKLFGKAKK